jgi:hypothetical protein
VREIVCEELDRRFGRSASPPAPPSPPQSGASQPERT